MISHHHKCIFVHIPKCAGKSIEHVFLDRLDLDWRTRAPLLLRPNDRPELGPPRLAHLKAHEYVRYKYVTQQQFDEYFKFSFVRNPWSRVVSMYKYMGFQKRYHFKKFVMSELAGDLWNQRYWFVGPQSEFLYAPSGELSVDFVGKFEHLQTGFNEVCHRLNLPQTQLRRVNWLEKQEPALPFMPQRLSTYILSRRARRLAPHQRSYEDYYDSESMNMVAKLYESDIRLFGYRFARGAVSGSSASDYSCTMLR